MAGHKPWSTLVDKMSPERQEKLKEAARGQRLGKLVAQIRKSSGLTQEELALRLGITQPRLSTVEGSGDMHVETLRRIIAELGGEVIIHMPDGDINLTQISCK